MSVEALARGDVSRDAIETTLGAGGDMFSRGAALLACDGVVGVGAGLSAHATERSGVSTCSIPHQPPPRHQPHGFNSADELRPELAARCSSLRFQTGWPCSVVVF